MAANIDILEIINIFFFFGVDNRFFFFFTTASAYAYL